MEKQKTKTETKEDLDDDLNMDALFGNDETEEEAQAALETQMSEARELDSEDSRPSTARKAPRSQAQYWEEEAAGNRGGEADPQNEQREYDQEDGQHGAETEHGQSGEPSVHHKTEPEDANSNAVEEGRKRKASERANPNPTLRVGTDCSGLDTPILALRRMGVPHRHAFSCDIEPYVRRYLKANVERGTRI